MIHQAPPFPGPGPVLGLQTQSEQSRDLGDGMKQTAGWWLTREWSKPRLALLPGDGLHCSCNVLLASGTAQEGTDGCRFPQGSMRKEVCSLSQRCLEEQR